MDTSKEYIQMCEKAKEIQEHWKPKVGHWFLNDFRGTTGFDKDTEKEIWGDDVEKWEVVQCLTYAPSITDYVTVSDSNGAHTYTMEDFFKHRHVWLPCQDHLQELLKDNTRKNHKNTLAYVKGPAPEGFIDMCIQYEFHKFIAMEEQYIDYVAFNSMDQFWLAFVMNENYKKRWDGKDWINSSA